MGVLREMKRWLGSTALCSVLAGFAGAFLSQWLLSPTPAYSQLVIPPPSRPDKRAPATEVDAQRFVLVDAKGTVMAEIKMDDGRPAIVLYDKDGRVGWKATPNPSGIRPISVNR
jgi:hypothetical protein